MFKSAHVALVLAIAGVAPAAVANQLSSTEASAYVTTYICGASHEPKWQSVLLPDGSPADFRSQGECVTALQQGQAVITNIGGAVDPSSGAISWAGTLMVSSGAVLAVVIVRPISGPCVVVSLYDENGNSVEVVIPQPGEFLSIPLTDRYLIFGPGSPHTTQAPSFGNLQVTVGSPCL